VATARHVPDREGTWSEGDYFRLKPLAPPVTREMQAYGSEVGYQFEELATVAERLGLRNKPEVDEHIGLIRGEFGKNLVGYKDAADHFWLRSRLTGRFR
jgi:hypothetical protein